MGEECRCEGQLIGLSGRSALLTYTSASDPKQSVSFILSSHSAIDALHRLQREQLSHRLPSSNKPGLTIFHQHFGNQRARVVVR